MRNKKIFAISIIATILIAMIIGLSISIVLVASKSSIASSLHIQYVVQDVKCTLTTSARYYHNDDDMEGIAIEQVDGYEYTRAINPEDNLQNNNGIFAYNSQELNANGRAVYRFDITNLGQHPCLCEAILNGESNNVLSYVGDSDMGSQIESDTLSYSTTIAVGSTATVVVVLNVNQKAKVASFSPILLLNLISIVEE